MLLLCKKLCRMVIVRNWVFETLKTVLLSLTDYRFKEGDKSVVPRPPSQNKPFAVKLRVFQIEQSSEVWNRRQKELIGDETIDEKSYVINIKKSWEFGLTSRNISVNGFERWKRKVLKSNFGTRLYQSKSFNQLPKNRGPTVREERERPQIEGSWMMMPYWQPEEEMKEWRYFQIYYFPS